MENAPVMFQISIYSTLVEVNSLISKARVRIFYKGLNRNRTYITDEIAEQLVNSLPYVPIKGIFDSESGDFTDHGTSRQEGQAYGLVPSKDDMNFAWEDHEDEDGETRTYACCDVYLWTGLYENASDIINHPQSMELNPRTVLGEWKKENNRRFFQFTFAEFLGLQCLGTEKAPCFEGAAFFSLIQDVQQMMQLFTQYEKSAKDLSNNYEGGKIMELNFKLSHEDIHSLLFRAMNPNANDAGGWVYNYSVGPVYDKYAIATSYDDGATYRVYYTKTDDGIVIGDAEKVYIVDVSEAEYNALEGLKAIGGTFAETAVKYQAAIDSVADYAAKLETANATIQTHESTINTLQGEKGTLETDKVTLTAELEAEKASNVTLTAEVGTLNEFKLAKEKAEKQVIIDKFAQIFDEEEMKDYVEKIDTYAITELEKDLALLYVRKQESTLQFTVVPNAGSVGKPLSGADTLIAKHVHKEEK